MYASIPRSVNLRDVDRAVADLADLDRDGAAARSFRYARKFLPPQPDATVEAAALWILSLSLFYAATLTAQYARNAMAVQAVIEDRYQRLANGPRDDTDAFITPLRVYPEPLSGFFKALSLMPAPVLKIACETLRNAFSNAENQRKRF
jgi:hypothetical protein